MKSMSPKISKPFFAFLKLACHYFCQKNFQLLLCSELVSLFSILAFPKFPISQVIVSASRQSCKSETEKSNFQNLDSCQYSNFRQVLKE